MRTKFAVKFTTLYGVSIRYYSNKFRVAVGCRFLVGSVTQRAYYLSARAIILHSSISVYTPDTGFP